MIINLEDKRKFIVSKNKYALKYFAYNPAREVRRRQLVLRPVGRPYHPAELGNPHLDSRHNLQQS